MQTLNTVVIIPNHLENGALLGHATLTCMCIGEIGSAGSPSDGSNSLFNIRWR